ncbi:MAG: sugar phosphate nucleotidyltransferase [Chitinophagaceae bacterium]|nr:sugar phosphate nucleotidyltransferase [Chitinophagaceae bacterium]
MKQKYSLVILAAGVGSRYGGIKQADAFGPSGEWIMDYAIYDAVLCGFSRVIIIVRKDILALIKEHIHTFWKNKISIEFIIQTPPKQSAERIKPWGSGHALLSCKDTLKEPFALVNADDFYGREAYKALSNFLMQVDNTKLHFAMVAYLLKETLSLAGSVSRGICELNTHKQLLSLVEKTHIASKNGIITNEEPHKEREILADNTFVSMNCWAFTSVLFTSLENQWNVFHQINKGSSKAEFYIPSAVYYMMQKENATIDIIPDGKNWIGITYKEEQAIVKEKIHKLVLERHYPDDIRKDN